MGDNTTELRALLGRLPQELYDEIYTLTFTAAPGIRKVGYTYQIVGGHGGTDTAFDFSGRFKAPDSKNLFLVDRASSQQFAKSYFGGEDVTFKCYDVDICAGWLRRLSVEHREMIRDVDLEVSQHQHRRGRRWLVKEFGEEVVGRVRFESPVLNFSRKLLRQQY